MNFRGKIIIYIYYVVFTLPKCYSYFNLYLNNAEVKRILGLRSEIYYVREGVVNNYGLSWTVPIAANVHDLYFEWEALLKKPVFYNMAIIMNNTAESAEKKALFEPKLNISMNGHIPRTPSTFKLTLPCTGHVSAEVDVTLNINVTSSKPEVAPTALYVKRKKICMKGESAEIYQPHQDPSGEDDDDVNMALIYYGVSAVCGVALVLLTVFGLALYRRRKIQAKESVKPLEIGSSVCGLSTKERMQTASSSFFNSSSPNNNMYTLPSSYTVNSYASLRKTPVAYFTPTLSAYSCQDSSPVNTYTYAHPMGSCDSNSQSSLEDSSSLANIDEDSIEEKKPFKIGSSRRNTIFRPELVVDPSTIDFREKFKMLQIERQRIRITAVMQEGKFGRVYRGWIQGEKRKLDQQVVIKTLREGCPSDEEVSLCREGTRLFNFFHQNILGLFGVSFSDNVPTFLIYSDLGSTNLKLHLRCRRDNKPLKTYEIVDFGLQAATGLHYLHSVNLLHADIAARNCVVNDDGRLRITDAALAADLFPSDYEILKVRDPPKPLKWMAYELLTDRLLSTASDVWSYGVLLWELVTHAQQPYENINPKEMEDYLREGYRLAQPRQCPDDLYQLMAFCWASVPYDRPRSERIVNFMKSFEKKLKSFV